MDLSSQPLLSDPQSDIIGPQGDIPQPPIDGSIEAPIEPQPNTEEQKSKLDIVAEKADNVTQTIVSETARVLEPVTRTVGPILSNFFESVVEATGKINKSICDALEIHQNSP
ncbi:hypothetical protein GPJ56_000819 [Histomonas meleagridis]|uniref:uncharacterized protein n=1 Tax=Histomonas meleagridis TaxID=135588 RepID=UPI00355A6D10|nr:hypothetical protein GPJ56_000819 [Histomonas meleagridis]KAH0804423.1 hypothetical protein GO595_003253 [Histomonas meleagridis]